MVLAAAVVLLGGATHLLGRGTAPPAYDVFRGEPAALRSVRGIAREARAGHGRGVIQLGLLLLVATPVTRVLLSLVGFALQGDRTYVAVTLLVLAVLLASLGGWLP